MNIDKYMLERIKKLCVVKHVKLTGSMEEFESDYLERINPNDIVCNTLVTYDGKTFTWEYDLVCANTMSIYDLIMREIFEEFTTEDGVKLKMAK